MKTHHPSSELILKLANAELDGSLASVVSAHIHQCVVCQQIMKKTELNLSEKISLIDSPLTLQETSEAWLKISSRLGSKSTLKPFKLQKPTAIEIDGQSYELPGSLRKLDTKNVKWMPFGKGGKISKLNEDGNKSLFLIYLASNEEVPEHSHSGTEYSYVISGSFTAGGMEFSTGDFSSSDQKTIHTPKATSPDGCLLLSRVENRLNFFHGYLKPFNGLIWWFLNWRFKWM